MSYYAVPHEKPPAADSVFTEIFNDRLTTLRTILADIAGDIKNRKGLESIILEGVDYDICTLKTQLHQLDMIGLRAGWNQIEQKITELENEKRMHRTRAWQDIASLKREFRSAFREYQDILRRFKIIEK